MKDNKTIVYFLDQHFKLSVTKDWLLFFNEA